MNITNLSADEAKAKIDSKQVIVVDVRTPEEYSKAKIAGSISLPLDQIEQKSDLVLQDKNQPVLVYCLSGSRSQVAADLLKEKGYQSIYNLTHGLMEWRLKQLPLLG